MHKEKKDSFHLLNTKFLMLSNYKTLQWCLLKTTGRDEEKTVLSLKTSVGKRTEVTDRAGKFWIPLYYVLGKSCFFFGLPNTEYFYVIFPVNIRHLLWNLPPNPSFGMAGKVGDRSIEQLGDNPKLFSAGYWVLYSEPVSSESQKGQLEK